MTAQAGAGWDRPTVDHLSVAALVAAIRGALSDVHEAREIVLGAREHFAEAHAELLAAWDGTTRAEPAANLAALLRTVGAVDQAAGQLHTSGTLLAGYTSDTLGATSTVYPPPPTVRLGDGRGWLPRIVERYAGQLPERTPRGRTSGVLVHPDGTARPVESSRGRAAANREGLRPGWVSVVPQHAEGEAALAIRREAAAAAREQRDPVTHWRIVLNKEPCADGSASCAATFVDAIPAGWRVETYGLGEDGIMRYTGTYIGTGEAIDDGNRG